jgi:hypothetical protein
MSSSPPSKRQKLAEVLACNPPTDVLKHWCDYNEITMDFQVNKTNKQRERATYSGFSFSLGGCSYCYVII